MSINSCALILAGYQSIYCENGPEVRARAAHALVMLCLDMLV